MFVFQSAFLVSLNALNPALLILMYVLYSEESSVQWLASLKTNSSAAILTSHFVTLVVASLLVAGTETVRTATIPVIVKIAEKEPSQVLHV